MLRRELLSLFALTPLAARALDGGSATPEPLPAALGDDVGSPPPEQAPDPNDPISVLYGRKLTFQNGVPLVTVRVLENQKQFTFVPHSAVKISTRGPVVVTAQGPKGGRWTVRVAKSEAGRAVSRVLVGEHLFSDPDGAEAEAKTFRDRGYKTLLLSVGTVYGIAGRAVDTRRILVLVEGDGSEERAQKLSVELNEKFGLRPDVHREPVARGRGVVEVLSPAGEVVARSPDALTIDTENDLGVVVERVEWGMGYAAHGFENRTYKGRMYAAVDAKGLVAAVNLVPLEELAKGIVPSEVFASAHPEALRAQAVTARGEILAKVGARHVGDPYLLCSEQHCQVFRGASGEDSRTSRAVDDTRGEALFAANQGPLVPSYYSAMCGGFTEDNDAVWGGVPDPSIRGRPDFPVTDATRKFADGIGEALVRAWIDADVPAYCHTASTSKGDKFRWKKSFTQDEVDAIAKPWGTGRIEALEVEGRGISGRARTLVLRGDRGEARIHSELAIRRAFHMLDSGAFVIDVEGEKKARRFTFRGAGWGHGAGMCQQGAIGRAEKGASYRDILTHYFGGAEVVRMYG